MTREEGLKILKENVSSANLIKHSLAVEAIMRALARHFKEDEEKWGLAGLLHDIDYDKVKDDLSQHSLRGAKMLEEMGVSQDVCRAVMVHNEAHGIEPQTLMEKALFTADPLSGLIVAATLVLPQKKISGLTTENVLNRFKEKSFARGGQTGDYGQMSRAFGSKLRGFRSDRTGGYAGYWHSTGSLGAFAY